MSETSIPNLHLPGQGGLPPKELVGAKGFYTLDNAASGLPVPPAAIVSTGMWKQYRENRKATIDHLSREVVPAILDALSDEHGLPLVSVRSSGAVSMPGMMDTILNVGITRQFLADAEKSGGQAERFAAELYANFLSMYGHSVAGMPKNAMAVPLGLSTIAQVQDHFKQAYADHVQKLPELDPAKQVLACILAVFDSWDSERAVLYRKLNKLPQDAGTAVVVQKMVYGNRNENSATGVMFSRNPNDGSGAAVGEFLVGAQGEAIVSGSQTPGSMEDMRDDFPDAYDELRAMCGSLEVKHGCVQEIEFTIDDGKVYLLQSRPAKCSPYAKMRTLMELKALGEITPKEVFEGMSLSEYMDLNVRKVDPGFAQPHDGKGLAASTGVLSGRVVFGPSVKYEGQPTVFVAKETTPDDLQAFHLSDGILTATGGATSHAAVVARSMGKVCVVGCSDLEVRIKNGVEQALLNGHVLESGDWITIDANTGRVWVGRDVPVQDARNSKVFYDLQDAVYEAHPEWTRVTSKVDDIVKGSPTMFLTYELDEVDYPTLFNELRDACQFLSPGIMDLTGKVDFLEKQHPGQFMFSGVLSEKAFLAKKKALTAIAAEAPIDQVFDFEVYLGPYHEQYESHLRAAGFKVCDPSRIKLEGEEINSGDLLLVQDPQTPIEGHTVAISSTNAIMRMMK